MAPASLPFHFSRSASVSIFALTTFARTGPEVPGVQALGRAMSGVATGVTRLTAQRSKDQPLPKGPKLSRCALLKPQPASWSRVHSLAFFADGEPLSRGPITSVR